MSDIFDFKPREHCQIDDLLRDKISSTEARIEVCRESLGIKMEDPRDYDTAKLENKHEDLMALRAGLKKVLNAINKTRIQDEDQTSIGK